MKLKSNVRIVLLLLLTWVCIACNESDSIRQMKFDFVPGYNRNSSFVVDFDRNVLEFGNLNSKANIDRDIKTYKISSETISKFKSQIHLIDLDTPLNHSRGLLDGIYFRACKILRNQDSICITTQSPERISAFELEYHFLDAFFELGYKTIDDYKSLCCLENIQDYFDYGLSIKQSETNPLEFRIWGSVFGDERDNKMLTMFLNGLPKDKVIVFDVRNGSINERAISIFEEYGKFHQFFFYGYNGAYSIKELKEYETARFKRTHKHPEFYGDINQEEEIEKRLVENWRTVGSLKSFRTKRNLLHYLNTMTNLK